MKLDLKDLRAKAEQQVAYFNKYPRDTVALKHEDPAVMLTLLDLLDRALVSMELAVEGKPDCARILLHELSELDAEVSK